MNSANTAFRTGHLRSFADFALRLTILATRGNEQTMI